MGCCTQSVQFPWWGSYKNATNDGKTTAKTAIGAITGDGDQWYMYIGNHRGAIQFAAAGVGYFAGRAGRDRFLRISETHVADFERTNGNSFGLLGTAGDVQIGALARPTIQHARILPAGLDELALVQKDLRMSGDVVGADPALLAAAVGIGESEARGWVLAMREMVGFSNAVRKVEA